MAFAAYTTEDLRQFHAKAWGNPWTRHTGTILRSEVVTTAQPIDESDSMDIDQDDKPVRDIYGGGFPIETTDKLEYVCIDGLFEAIETLDWISRIRDTLVVRSEYELLRRAMENIPPREAGTQGIVVTGQPGTGKTAFLIYLLLHRLQHRLPTAIQNDLDRITIFDDGGATVFHVNLVDRVRLRPCWALVDSNATVIQPCHRFQTTPQFLIQSASPKLERWKQWLKQNEGICVYSELPTMLEIGAIFKELNFQPASAFPIVNTWGPSIRAALEIMEGGERVPTILEKKARSGADTICHQGSVSLCSPESLDSNILFIRPHRPHGFDIGSSELYSVFIPTPFLNEIFEARRSRVSNINSLQLFQAFSKHSLTRVSAGWSHEIIVHHRLCSNGKPFPIFNADATSTMPPSTHLLPGTARGLKGAEPNIPFYWMPSVVNLPGVDSVLGDGSGNIYAVQATIASDYSSPYKGLKKIWDTAGPSLQKQGVWHFVIASDTKSTADTHVAKFSQELKDKTFGPQKVCMKVWGCVITPSSPKFE